MTRVSETLEIQRRRYLADVEFANSTRVIPAGRLIETPTRYVALELIRQLIRDRDAGMDVNDWADYSHTVVPISYADAVILDRQWAARAGQVRARLQQSGVLARIADVYTSRTLEEFWRKYDV